MNCEETVPKYKKDYEQHTQHRILATESMIEPRESEIMNIDRQQWVSMCKDAQLNSRYWRCTQILPSTKSLECITPSAHHTSSNSIHFEGGKDDSALSHNQPINDYKGVEPIEMRRKHIDN